MRLTRIEVGIALGVLAIILLLGLAIWSGTTHRAARREVCDARCVPYRGHVDTEGRWGDWRCFCDLTEAVPSAVRDGGLSVSP